MDAGGNRNDNAGLKLYKTIPVHVVEDHNDVLPHIYRAIGSRHLPLGGVQMLHFDSHPDMLVPACLIAQDVFNKDKLFDELSIENWIIPSVYAGHITNVVWLKPPWANQIKDSCSIFGVGRSKTDDKIRVTSKESYFLSELLYESEERLEDVKCLEYVVRTVGKLAAAGSQSAANGNCDAEVRTDDVECRAGSLQDQLINKSSDAGDPDSQRSSPAEDVSFSKEECSHEKNDTRQSEKRKSTEVEKTPPKSLKRSAEKASCDMSYNLGAFKGDQPFVLDIDLDFFSTQNPFQGMYSEYQNELLRKLYVYIPPEDSSDEAIKKCIDRRKEQLSELKCAFEVVSQGGTPVIDDKERSQLFSDLVNDLVRTECAKPIDWQWLHEIGCTCDDTELPHHISTKEEIKQLMDDVRSFLSDLPKPTLITIARSSDDDYCPHNQVDSIQDSMIHILEELYGNITILQHYC